jgi:uncharacterized membrane protein YhaH (DUF805 family)
MKWFFEAMRKYAVFTGRSRRKEYWYFLLFLFLLSVLLTAVDVLLGTFNDRYSMGLFTGILTLITTIPWIAISVRRLHDIGYSGQWLWVFALGMGAMIVNYPIGSLIVVVLSIAFMVAAFVDGDPGVNKYGPSPK